MKKVLVLLLFTANVVSIAHAKGTLCEADEQVIFSCAIAKSQKVLSVCGSKLLTAEKGYLQYRFGRPADVEMTYPTTKADTQKQFRWVTNYHADVVDNWLTFKNGTYSYSVFAIEDHDTKSKRAEYRRGVVIGAPNGREHTLKCAEPVIGNLETLRDVVPEGDEGQ
jgi:hypothetical protein